MNFRRLNRDRALSECGNYELRAAKSEHGAFYNAWHLPTDKHIDASYSSELVKRSCREHAAKLEGER